MFSSSQSRVKNVDRSLDRCPVLLTNYIYKIDSGLPSSYVSNRIIRDRYKQYLYYHKLTPLIKKEFVD